jgi:hypothetical protein
MKARYTRQMEQIKYNEVWKYINISLMSFTMLVLIGVIIS